MVEAIADHSNNRGGSPTPEELQVLLAKARHGRRNMPPEPPVSRRLSRRLSSEQLEEIRAKYRAGASTHELRTEFDLAQGSVLKILNGVMRTRALSEAQVAEAVKLHEQGFGIQRIANQIEASYTGTRNALLRSGVTMRGRLDYQHNAK